MERQDGRPFPVKLVHRRRYETDQYSNAHEAENLGASDHPSPINPGQLSERISEVEKKDKDVKIMRPGESQAPANQSCILDANTEQTTVPKHAGTAGTVSGRAYDITFVEPVLVWKNSNIDAEDGEEAPVPDDFDLFDGEDEDYQIKAQKHQSAPLPDFYSLEIVPGDLTTLPLLEYYPMNPDVEPARLLVILPHFGNPYSTVECNLFPVSLKEEHYCFAAMENTRGNKHLTSHIVVNNCVKQVTRNVEVLLRHSRREQFAMVVWIREICIDVCDFNEHRTPEWRDRIFSRACTRLDMSDFMYRLEANGILEKEKQFTIRPKEWTKVNREARLPTYYPIALRTFTNEQLKGNQADIPTIPHEYLPLDLVAEEIRLIVLMPSEDPDAPVVAHLAHESMYGPAAYQCLSYTWGDGKATEDLILNNQLLKIRKNLAAALKAIRHRGPTQLVTLWVDAVCINQNDIAERNRQVARMHQIYELADAVLIWLGDSDEDSDLAMDFAEELKQSNTPVFEVNDPQQGLTTLISTEALARKWAALYRLLLRPYFRRLWIVQELTLASIPTAFCGLKCVSWNDIHQASLVLQLHQPQIRALFHKHGISVDENLAPARPDHEGCPNCFQPRQPDIDLTLPHKLTWHREMRKGNHLPSFLYLCLLNRDTECANPRDKIYALWNLAREANELADFQPDYSLPIRAVYVRFTQAYIQATRSLDIICTPGNYCYKGVESLSLPSWVTDWRFRSAVNCYIRPDGLPIADTEQLTAIDRPLYRTARGTTAMTSFFGKDSGSLVCAGMIADIVVHVSTAKMDPDKWFEEAKEWCHRDDQPIESNQLNRQFTSMTMNDPTSSWESGESLLNIRWVGGDLTASEAISKQVHIMPGKVVQSPIKARTLIVTSKGYMGLAPYWAQAGQEVAILMGCSVPVLLERHDNHFHVKGDCFVQGWMNGEMLDALNMTDEEVMQHVAETTQPIVLQ